MDSNPNLRIHVEEDLAREERLKQRLLACLPEANALAEQFETTTGWLLNYSGASTPGDFMADQAPTPVFGRFEISDMSARWPAGKPTVSRAESEKLVANINRLVSRIERLELNQHQSQGTLIEANEDSPLIPTNLSDKVANLLRFAKQEFSAMGAAVYMLDEATTHLRLRSMIAPVPFASEVESVRSLENSLADLESLIGNKVNIHSREMGETWKIPRPFQFGWCVVLGTKNLPLGTIWIFFSQERSPTVKELEFLESLNNQLYSEINSREKPQNDPAADLLQQELLMAARSNDARLPSFAPEIDGWKIAGWTYRHGYLASTFHDWAITPTGNLSVAVGQATGPMLTAAISLNNLRSLVSAHREYRHTSQSMAAKLNEQIWCQSPGDETASLIYLLADPETNHVHMVNAGDGGVVFNGPRGVQSIDQFQSPLGIDLESTYVQWEQFLKESDTIVMFSPGLRHAISESTPSANDADLLRAILLTHPGHPHAILAAIEERFFNSDFQHVSGDLSVVVLAKNSQVPDVHQISAEVSKSILAELRAEEGDLLEVLVKRVEPPDHWNDEFYTDVDATIDAEEFDEHWSQDDSTLGVIMDDDSGVAPLPKPVNKIVAPVPAAKPGRKPTAKTKPHAKPKSNRVSKRPTLKAKTASKKPTKAKHKQKPKTKAKAIAKPKGKMAASSKPTKNTTKVEPKETNRSNPKSRVPAPARTKTKVNSKPTAATGKAKAVPNPSPTKSIKAKRSTPGSSPRTRAKKT
ncbi:MAG: SpoIIE family protein phosphatase [Pirellulaceae bacterium]|nr:SpoIIE family protein phosphatase [Pirellulaceae bacterium]